LYKQISITKKKGERIIDDNEEFEDAIIKSKDQINENYNNDVLVSYI
jgi:hypothetical protein